MLKSIARHPPFGARRLQYSPESPLETCLNAIGRMIHRQRERETLGNLSDRQLADIGLRRDEAARVAAKPFWRR